MQLKKGGKKTSIKSFGDPSISEGLVLIDLVDVIKRGSINYDLVTPGGTDEVTFNFTVLHIGNDIQFYTISFLLNILFITF